MRVFDIIGLLDMSRKYIANSKKKMAQMGFCCSASLARLETNQDYFERMAYQQRPKQLGWIWLATAVGSVAAYLGTYVYKHYTESKIQSDYLDCLDKRQKELMNAGISESDALQQASAICGNTQISQKNDFSSLIKLAIYGAIAVSAFYFGAKLVSRKK